MLHAQFTQALVALLRADLPAFVWGAPGIGKSDSVRSVCAAEGFTLVEERLSQMESIDLRGTPHVEGARVSWAIPTMISRLWAIHDAGERPALFLDEMNQAAASTMSAAYQLVLDREIGPHKLPPGCVVIAAGNRLSDRASAQRMPSALANRFAHLDLDCDADSWRVWAQGAGIAPELCAFIAFRPELIHRMPQNDARAFPSPRSWAMASRIIGAPETVRAALLRGVVGEEAAGEVEAFLRVWQRLPSLDSILANPQGAILPQPHEPALAYAICGALARRADRSNFAAVLAYAQRLDGDYRALLVTDAIRRDPSLQETRAYVEHVVACGEVLS